ncbi:hypothetical protein ANANG_G00027090 [Anguilla anguilla]|uniref:Uncharacterized protein n=1 Tax=Anguilla anguilla TaxID=7936 RepID=A0A9D3S866_ANGAN|nr:hypothetical protein ANANG_G00027090 [Anguilla anguilla]
MFECYLTAPVLYLCFPVCGPDHQTSVQDPSTFLMQHLRKDLEQLTQTLGLGADDTVTAIHVLLSSLPRPHLLPRSRIRASFCPPLPGDSLVPRGSVGLQGEGCPYPTWPTSWSRAAEKTPFPSLDLPAEGGGVTAGEVPAGHRGSAEDLVRKISQNRTDLTYGTIGELIQNQREGEITIPAELCQEDLALSSDLQVLLPQRQGVGLCSTALVSYLIALHNQLVYATDRHTGEEETSYTVSVTDLSELHVIGYEPERDLIPLVLSNCQYSLERGQETLSQYDLPKIQQLILSRILQGKPLIALSGIPTLFSRQSRHYERVFTDVKAKVGQEPLPALKAASLAGQLQTHSDVCDTLGVVELALDFLSAAGGHAHMELVSYLEDVLRMERLAPHVLKALSRCSLKHCVALWQFLSSLRSESMLRLKRYREPLDEEARRLLMGFCSRGSVQAVRLEMHQFLLLHLNTNRDPELYRPDWGLKEMLQSYVERKDLDLPPE